MQESSKSNKTPSNSSNQFCPISVESLIVEPTKKNAAKYAPVGGAVSMRAGGMSSIPYLNMQAIHEETKNRVERLEIAPEAVLERSSLNDPIVSVGKLPDPNRKTARFLQYSPLILVRKNEEHLRVPVEMRLANGEQIPGVNFL